MQCRQCMQTISKWDWIVLVYNENILHRVVMNCVFEKLFGITNIKQIFLICLFLISHRFKKELNYNYFWKLMDF